MLQWFRTFLWMISISTAFSQTLVDLRTQSKNVDFAAATSTRPFKSGTSLPAVCSSGEMFYKTDAPAGANLYGCVSQNAWSAEGQGGMSMLSQTGDLAVTRTSPVTLTIGAGCSAATPCNVRFGNSVYSIISSATATLTGGSGVAFIFVSSSGTLTIGSTLTLNCSGSCSAQAGITSFPADSVPLSTWSATSGAWDVNGAADLRAFESTKVVQAGTGLMGIDNSGKTVLSVDTALVGIRTAVPASSAAACVTGSWAMDGSFLYLCVGPASWRRVAVSLW